MQRWIYITVMACLLIGGGSLYFLMKMRENRDDSRWVAMSIRQDITAEQKTTIVAGITKYLNTDKTLNEIVDDLQLIKLLQVADAEAAKNALSKKTFVRIGKKVDPITKAETETIDIGVYGKRKEAPILDKIATHLGGKVGKMIDAETKKTAQ